MQNENILTVREDTGTGAIGFALDGVNPDLEISVASEGLLVAHDLIEHQNGLQAIGPIDDEMQALGGVWFVRGCMGELRRDGVGARYSIEENLASDFSRMVVDHCYSSESLVVPFVPELDDEETESAFAEIIRIAKAEAESELDDESKLENADAIAEFWGACLPNLRAGYIKARDRFGDVYEANAQFWAIVEAVEPYLKNVGYEGQQIKLTWGDGRAVCEEHFEFDQSEYEHEFDSENAPH